jgi:hypothetical protein
MDAKKLLKDAKDELKEREEKNIHSEPEHSDTEIEEELKVAAASLPKFPWFFRPRALFDRRLKDGQKIVRCKKYEDYLNNVCRNALSRDNFYFVARFF